MATTAQRRHMVAVMAMMYSHRAELGYPPGDQRTGRDSFSWGLSEQAMEHYLAGGGTVQFDCSEYVPWVLRCAGCWPWSQPGATGTHLQIWAARRWTIYENPKDAGIGAVVIFGEGSGHHEAIVKVPDPKTGNPLLSSHGRPGLDELRLRDEQARQPPGLRFLSIVKL